MMGTVSEPNVANIRSTNIVFLCLDPALVTNFPSGIHKIILILMIPKLVDIHFKDIRIDSTKYFFCLYPQGLKISCVHIIVSFI